MGQDVGEIDVIVKKKPSGSGHATITIGGGHIQVMNLGATPIGHGVLTAIGEMVQCLLTVDPRSSQERQAIFAIQTTARGVKQGGINN